MGTISSDTVQKCDQRKVHYNLWHWPKSQSGGMVDSWGVSVCSDVQGGSAHWDRLVLFKAPLFYTVLILHVSLLFQTYRD